MVQHVPGIHNGKRSNLITDGGGGAQSDSSVNVGLNDEKRKHRRRKLWEIDPAFHCSIIGTCFTLSHLKRIAKRSRLCVKKDISDHNLHAFFVKLAAQRGLVSRKLYESLDRKFQPTLRRFSRAKTEPELVRLWKEATESGDTVGAYWAIMTHAHVPPSFLHRIYGEVHMLSHLAGASRRVNMRSFHVLQRKQANLEQAWANAKTALKIRDQRLEAWGARLARALWAENQLEQVQAQLRHMQSGAEFQALKIANEDLVKHIARERGRFGLAAERLVDRERRIEELETVNRELDAIVREAGAECAILERELQTLLSRELKRPDQGDSLPDVNLGGRSILYVGGHTNLIAHYRVLVEHHNGKFLHHDGGLEHSRARLPAVVARADAVVCPWGCVSHDACLRVKRFCKQHAKPLVMLPSPGLSSLATGLCEVASR